MSTDLTKTAGFELAFSDPGELMLPSDLASEKGVPRTVEYVAPFALPGIQTDPASEVYRIFRDIHAKNSRADGLRYDITVVHPGLIGFQSGEKEFFRTAGHYHKGLKDPEVYEVLSGRGQWLMQRASQDPAIILEAYLVEAGPGEKILIPPGFGHITINGEKKPLIEANVLNPRVENDYALYQKFSGGCYRILEAEDPSLIEIKPNPRYHQIPAVRKLKPKKDWFKGYFEPLWRVFSTHPADLQFLASPETYRPEFFAIDRVYQEIT